MNMKNLRMIKKIFSSLAIVSAMSLISACDPEQMDVKISTSAIERAMNGEVATAKVTIVYNCGDRTDEQLERPLAAARKYVGKGGSARVLPKEEDATNRKAEMNLVVPVHAASNPEAAADSLMSVVIAGDVIMLKTNTRLLDALNEESGLGNDEKLTFKADNTKIRIVGNSGKDHVFSALAVKVDAKAYLQAIKTIEDGDFVTFEFDSSSKAYYSGNGVMPQIRIDNAEKIKLL